MKVLLVEDEEQVARMLGRFFRERGHEVEWASSGGAAVERGRGGGFDVAVLDWVMPDLEGIAVLRLWRAAGLRFPVLMLTGRDETQDKVEALRAGADDYLTKPFEFEELLARLEALFRRAAPDATFTVGPATVDPRKRTVAVGERSQKLTDREMGLLVELARTFGTPVSRAALLATVWRGEPVNPNVVDVYVGYLRAKLADLGTPGLAVEAVRKVGFRLAVA